MRHLIFGVKLGRDTKARKALLKNLATAIFENGQVTTTLAKAKFAQSYVEKLITLARSNNLANKRRLASLISSQAFAKLVSTIGPANAQRNGGYTRIIKLNVRSGDSSKMARLEFVEMDKKPITAAKTSSVPSKSPVPKVVTKQSSNPRKS